MPKQTTVYDVVKSWIESCKIDSQLDTVKHFIENVLVTDELTKDALLNLLLKKQIFSK